MNGEKLTGTLLNGFEYELDLANARSMRFIDALAEATDENALAFSKAVKILLGDEQREALYKYIEAQGQTPDVEIIANIMGELMQASADLKK